MKLNDLLNFRTANKFIVTEDFNDKILVLWNGTTPLNSLPKGLIFTLTSIRFNNITQTMRCKIIRSKKIIETIYKPNNIDPKFYTLYRWNKEIDEDGYASFALSGEQLFTFLNTVKADQFTSEYKRITDEGSESYL
jgi:hypothetical protein